MKDNDTFGKRLKTLRTARGFSQGTLAAKIGASRRSIGYYESESKYPPGKMLADIAKALDVSMDVLMGTEDIRRLEKNNHPKNSVILTNTYISLPDTVVRV